MGGRLSSRGRRSSGDTGGGLTLFVLFVAIFGTMIVEARRAAGNEQIQRARGGIEPRGDVFRFMQVLYPGLFLAMIVEGAVRGTPPVAAQMAGAAVFLAAKLLKWWAISSLGPFWTFRVIVIPGVRLVSTGPYRYLRHPNYVAVLGEFAGTGLVAGATLAGPLALFIFGTLILKRIAVEERALRL